METLVGLSLGLIFLVIVVEMIVCGSFCAFLAKEKNRSPVAWFFLGAFFSLFALIAITGVPKRVEHIEQFGDKYLQRAPVPRVTWDDWVCSNPDCLHQNDGKDSSCESCGKPRMN